MDCFYAAVHVRDDPSLAGLPVVIGGSPGGRGVIAAASYEARKFGVRSAMPSSQAVRRCPHLVFIKPDFPRYRSESERILAILGEFTEVIQPVSIDEAYLDVTDQLSPWGSATAIAREIRRRVSEERGLTVSVGVGPSRLVAKLASDFDKPDGLTVVRPRAVSAFLDPLPVRRLPGVGPATERRLKRKGFEIVSDLRRHSAAELEALLGSYGRTLSRYAHGVDERPVRVSRERKSLSCERTYAEDLKDLATMDEELERMAERVARGLARREIAACTFTVKIRYPDFTTLSRSRTIAPTADGLVIAVHAKALLRRSEAAKRSVRLLGVGASKLVHGRRSQLELFAEASG